MSIALSRASAVTLALLSLSAQADQVIPDDLIVQSSLCAGADCAVNESFSFDTILVKTSNPLIRFEDTSTGSFPGNDWSMGITQPVEGEPTRFTITDESGGTSVLILEGASGGGVALGAGSSLETGAISVGAAGSERRIANVADGVEASDAVTLGQFNAFQASINDNFETLLATERSELDSQIGDLEGRLQDLTDRLDSLVAQLGLD